MKTCPRCGHENTDSVRFCIECQHRFGSPGPSSPGSPEKQPSTEHAPKEPLPPPVIQNRESPPVNPAGAPQVKKPEEATPSKISRPSSARRSTTFQPASSFDDAGTETAARQAAGRRIVGVLVTYTWKAEGQLFALREGRNLIGRDPDQCEIAVSEDSALSARNTIISYRSSFRIADDDSMSGTYVDGEILELRESRVLQNYSTIRTGSTEWLFIAIEPDESARP